MGLLGYGAPFAAGEGCLAVGGDREAGGHRPGTRRVILSCECARLQKRDVQVCGGPGNSHPSYPASLSAVVEYKCAIFA